MRLKNKKVYAISDKPASNKDILPKIAFLCPLSCPLQIQEQHLCPIVRFDYRGKKIHTEKPDDKPTLF